MFDELVANLKKEAAPQLISKLGLSDTQANNSISAAASSVQDVLGGKHGFNVSDIAGLFGSGQKGSGIDAIKDKLGASMLSSLTGKAGLEQGMAGKVQSMLMPMLMDMVGKHVGGDSNKLQSLLGGLTGSGDIAEKAKGMLGGLFGKK